MYAEVKILYNLPVVYYYNPKVFLYELVNAILDRFINTINTINNLFGIEKQMCLLY